MRVWSLEEPSGLAEDMRESPRAKWQPTLRPRSLRERGWSEEKEAARMLAERRAGQAERG